MHIQDFVKIYQTKSDEELIQLAGTQEALVPDAQLALAGELSRRQIDIPKYRGDSRREHGQDGPSGTICNMQDDQRLGVGDFVADVLRSYHGHFWLFFRIMAPAVTISTIASARDQFPHYAAFICSCGARATILLAVRASSAGCSS